MDNEFRSYFDSWNNSKKNRDFIKQISDKRDYLLKNLNLAQMELSEKLTKEQIESWIDWLTSYSVMDTEEKHKFETSNKVHKKVNDQVKFLKEYAIVQSRIGYYLKKYVLLEDYEFAAKIRDAIKLREEEAIRQIFWYFEDDKQINEMMAVIYDIKKEIQKRLEL